MRLGDLDDLKVHISELILVYSGTELDNAILNAIDNATTIKTFTLLDIEEQYRKGLEKGLSEWETERPQGEWIKQYGKSYELITNEGVLVGEFTKCPKCQYDKARGSNYCPNCGADMRGDKHEID